jgi:hypothetical protein
MKNKINRNDRGRGLEQAVEKYLQWRKIMYIRIENYRCFRCGQIQNSKARGFPDFFCYYPRIVAIECKTGKYSKLSPNQKIVRDAMVKSGIDYIVVRDNISELIKYFED